VVKKKKTNLVSHQEGQTLSNGTEGVCSSGNLGRGDSMTGSNFDQFSRFDSAKGPSIAGGIVVDSFSRFNSSKGPSIGGCDIINRNDSSLGGNDYGRIDSTKIGSSNAVSSVDKTFLSVNNKT
jgi:hypothetical protein